MRFPDLSHKMQFVIPDRFQGSQLQIVDRIMRSPRALPRVRDVTGNTLKLSVSLIFWMVLQCFSVTLQAQFASMGQFQLASPSIEVTHTFFEESTTISLELDTEGVIMRYTLNGEAVAENSRLYGGPIKISTSATIKARAYHADYQTSDEVNVQVIRINKSTAIEVSYRPNPAPQYAGQGAVTLSDLRKGSMNFRDGHWLGFSEDTIVFDLTPQTSIRQLHLSVLADHGSWIFTPSQIEVWQGATPIGSWQASAPTSFAPKSFQFISIPMQHAVRGAFQLKVIMGKIPDWHDGKGTTPWLFIDEIFSH